MDLPFVKMHGLGNSYIYIDLFQFDIDEKWLPTLSKAVSNCNTGVGSDGLILMQPSKKAALGMRIFNKDGSEGQSCGNGLRCTAKYAYENGIVKTKRFQIETMANIVEVEVNAIENIVHKVTINMGQPRLRRVEVPMMGDDDVFVIDEPFVINGETLKLTALSMGNPHAVFFVDTIAHAPVESIGSLIETDRRFPDRINVEFVEILSKNELNFRVWERGSGMTQACGTGACAAVVAAVLNKRINKDEEITVHLDGGDLLIKWAANNQVWMTGGADVVATGIYQFVI